MAPTAPGQITAPLLIFTNEITSDDLDLLQDFIPLLKNYTFKHARLNSTGGKIRVAMAIGKILRAEGFHTYIGRPDECLSACVLVLAGSAERSVDGKVGIHRPYLEEAIGTTPAEQKSIQDKIGGEIKAYLTESNVPTALYDAMMRVPPSKIRYLEQNELTDFGLNQTDPYLADARETSAAKALGVTRKEYMQLLEQCRMYTKQFSRECASKLIGRPFEH